MKILKTLAASSAVFFMSAGAFAAGLDFTTLGTKLAKNPNYIADTINPGLGDFAEQLAISIPQAATQQNVWADAYIGKSFPSVPPHFGGGVNMALTHIDTSGLAEAASALGIDNIEDSYYFPCFTADLRVGGVLLPFDVDIAVMKTGTIDTSVFGSDLSVDFFTIGADVRYALLEGGLIFPKLSVGAGYFYNQGTFGASSDNGSATIDYKVHTLYGQVQVSKSFLLFTPFLGLRGLVSKYDNTYDWEYKGSYASQIEAAASLLGKTVETKGSGSYKSDAFDFGGIQPQVFAGVGVNFLVLQATLSVSADLRNLGDSGLWSGAFSFRAKL